jgi:protease I
MPELTVVCLLGQGFEDSEFRVPYDRLRSSGVHVDIVGARAGEELKGYRGKETVRADRGIDEARPEDYDALLIPGGYSPDHLRADERFVSFVKRFDARGRTVAAVCHGPQLLISAELVRGRTLTAWKTIQGDLRQIGATVLDEPVVTDGNWITSRQPSDLEAFSDALLSALEPAWSGVEAWLEAEQGMDTERQRLRRESPEAASEGPRSATPRDER